MRTSYTKDMKKKIDLTDLFEIDEEEDDPLVLNINEMNLEERTLLFDKLYQDYIILMADKKSPVKVVKNYKRLLKEISVNYFN
jgi:hypothetical protein